MFLVEIIIEAINKKATDIHFINQQINCVIKFRIEDRLVFFKEINKEAYSRVIVYLKFKSHMNLNQSKSPQSSAFDVKINDQMMRIRISTLPAYDSESIVLRINLHQFMGSISELLLCKDKSHIFQDLLHHASGLILITGPTCSGKTTLTYSLLNDLKLKGMSIVSIEDPIEHFEQGFIQLQVNEDAGVTYETGVKEILRHDPDIIFIGEIRDEKTAKSAIRASLTGHMVISTMHATDCIKALYRFIEFGLSIYDLQQTLLLVTNQRLIVFKEKKKIIFESLAHEKLNQAIHYIKNGGNFTYKKIEDDLKQMYQNMVMKP